MHPSARFTSPAQRERSPRREVKTTDGDEFLVLLRVARGSGAVQIVRAPDDVRLAVSCAPDGQGFQLTTVAEERLERERLQEELAAARARVAFLESAAELHAVETAALQATLGDAARQSRSVPGGGATTAFAALLQDCDE